MEVQHIKFGECLQPTDPLDPVLSKHEDPQGHQLLEPAYPLNAVGVQVQEHQTLEVADVLNVPN